MTEALPDGFAFQFEAIGPGIQKNPLKLSKVEPRVFNLFDIRKHVYADSEALLSLCAGTGVPCVAVLEQGNLFDMGDDELRKYAERTYPNGSPAEGVVFRPVAEQFLEHERVSFKAINLLYKDKS